MVPNAKRSAVSDAVVELGKKLVAELGLEDASDTLGRWMAHYVAELVADVEASSQAERPAKEARCAAAILELWRHRHDMPHRGCGFEAEPLLRAMASLDPEKPHYRYFAGPRESAEGEDEGVRRWLRLADGIDATARILVVQCLVAAAAEARDKSREWIAMAEAAGIEDDAPAAALRFVNNEADALGNGHLAEVDREKLGTRLKRLKAFVRLAKMLENQLTAQLGSIAAPQSESAKSAKLSKRHKPRKLRKSGRPRGRRKSTKGGRKRNVR